MNVQNYVISKIKQMGNLFPFLNFRYEFREIGQAHIIELSPLKDDELPDEYIAFEENFYNEFTGLFPDQSLLFIEKDDIIEIENSQYEFPEKENESQLLIRFIDELKNEPVEAVTGFKRFMDNGALKNAKFSTEQTSVYNFDPTVVYETKQQESLAA